MESDFSQIGIKIISEKGYNLVDLPEGVDYWHIVINLSTLFSMPEFADNNDLWVFREGQFNITYADLFNIRDYVTRICPENRQGQKTAIVVATGMQGALAQIFKNIIIDLPGEFRVFNDFHSAENWLIELG